MGGCSLSTGLRLCNGGPKGWPWYVLYIAGYCLRTVSSIISRNHCLPIGMMLNQESQMTPLAIQEWDLRIFRAHHYLLMLLVGLPGLKLCCAGFQG